LGWTSGGILTLCGLLPILPQILKRFSLFDEEEDKKGPPFEIKKWIEKIMDS
jgi:hypothetical protein